MKQFNLKEYLSNPSRKVVTRSGKPVRIICTDAVGSHPIVGLVKQSNGIESTCNFYEYGTVDKNRKCDNDLFFAPVKKVIWGNLYSTQLGTTFTGDFYKTEEAALKEKEKDFSKYITTFKVEWEE